MSVYGWGQVNEALLRRYPLARTGGWQIHDIVSTGTFTGKIPFTRGDKVKYAEFSYVDGADIAKNITDAIEDCFNPIYDLSDMD